MKRYVVKTLDKIPAEKNVDFASVQRADIDCYKWLSGYEPEAFAKVAFIPGDGFYVRLSCREAEPVAKHFGKGVSVCLDSALEFFLDAAGDGKNYLNVETNSAGALLAEFGPVRHHRRGVSELFDVKASRDGEFWYVEYRLPLDTLAELFGDSVKNIGSGHRFTGNFYKCGDDTPAPHYGMWNPVDSEIPDFHRPDGFGELIIE